MTIHGNNVIRISKKRIAHAFLIIIVTTATGIETGFPFLNQIGQSARLVPTIRAEEETNIMPQSNNLRSENQNNSTAFREPEPLISDGILGAIVGGVIGLLSGIIVQLVNSWITRPKLSINRQAIEYDFNYPKVPHPKEGWDTEYLFTGTRIKIKNQGRTAAEECKATVIIDKKDYRVAWTIPKEDFSVSINAHDSEYIDLCAIKIGETTRFLTDKQGYGKSQEEGILLPPGDIQAQLKISAKNAKHRTTTITIHSSPDVNKKIVHFT
jgi:hypothetical protein